MIIWDFSVIVALGMTLTLGVVIGCWVFYTLKRGPLEVVSDRQFFRQCGFCGYLYFDYFKRQRGICPRCHSYQE